MHLPHFFPPAFLQIASDHLWWWTMIWSHLLHFHCSTLIFNVQNWFATNQSFCNSLCFCRNYIGWQKSMSTLPKQQWKQTQTVCYNESFNLSKLLFHPAIAILKIWFLNKFHFGSIANTFNWQTIACALNALDFPPGPIIIRMVVLSKLPSFVMLMGDP